MVRSGRQQGTDTAIEWLARVTGNDRREVVGTALTGNRWTFWATTRAGRAQGKPATHPGISGGQIWSGNTFEMGRPTRDVRTSTRTPTKGGVPERGDARYPYGRNAGPRDRNEFPLRGAVRDRGHARLVTNGWIPLRFFVLGGGYGNYTLVAEDAVT
ncbi:hypothetical protein [Amycolatopsis thermoflava]|nr:hypothetical protein [Amycolatopsis thermoflava]